MKKVLIILSIILLTSLLVSTPALAASPIINGSFETGDYSGWTLWESPGPSWWGTWGIAKYGDVINRNDSTYDFYHHCYVTQSSPGLPITYIPSDGQYMAYQLQRMPQDHRMYQDVTLDRTVKSLSLDMFYINHFGSFDDQQYLAINIRDLSDNILHTLFKTIPGDSLSIPMSNYVFDISAFAGSTVRIDIEMRVQKHMFDAGFDNIIAVVDDLSYPPGWGEGKKTAWGEGEKSILNNGIPSGLSKQDKIPLGFEEGAKRGWD